MKRIVLFISITWSSMLCAQDILHHEIALDAAPLLRSGSSNLTGMYRYYLNDLAFRCQGMVAFNHVNNDVLTESTTPAGINGNTGTDQTTNNLQVQLRIGLQKTIQFEKWGAYGGADALFNYTGSESTSETITPGSYGSSRNTSGSSATSTGYGAAPVLGIFYKVNSRIQLSLENSFTFLYSQNTSRQKTDYYFTPVKGVEGLNSTSTYSNSGTSTSLDFSPSRYIRLFVAFRF